MARVFAIIPAAGESQRMGQHKLLLPWKSGAIIDAVLGAWSDSCVDRIIVVMRQSDQALRDACGAWDADIVCPEVDPVDMKASIQAGLTFLQREYSPTAADRWMVAPADLPYTQQADHRRSQLTRKNMAGRNRRSPLRRPNRPPDVISVGPRRRRFCHSDGPGTELATAADRDSAI